MSQYHIAYLLYQDLLTYLLTRCLISGYIIPCGLRCPVY